MMAKRKGQILDYVMAAAAAGSAAFALLAMPTELFSELVWRSRIDLLIPAATPPLGDTARIAAAAGAALILFALVLLLMRALDRPRKRLSRAEVRATPPRIRRADAHPDAPSRAPLFAGDLGEPLDAMPIEEPFDLAEVQELEQDVSPLPSFLVEQPPEQEPGNDDFSGDAEPPRAHSGSISSLAAQLPVAEAEESASISEMMERFEAGVASRNTKTPLDLSSFESEPAQEAVEAEEPKPEPEEIFDLPQQHFAADMLEPQAEEEEFAPEAEAPAEAIAPVPEPEPVAQMPHKSQAIGQSFSPAAEPADNIETRLRSAIKDLRRTARGG
jgi:hypothetical protein